MSGTSATVKTGLFPPPKRGGILFHLSLVALLLVASGWGFWNLAGSPSGPNFVLFLVVGIVAFAPLPFLGYRLYALYRAAYQIDRETLEIRWGLRSEVIPLGDIEWVRPIEELSRPLRLPPTAMPGAILGHRRHDGRLVEFIASRARGILLVGTPARIYAISPADPAGFLDTFARAVELGSLRQAEAKSQFPSFVLARAWESGAARFLWLSALFLNLGLAVWISLLIPSSPLYALGVRPEQSPAAVPSTQLIILPLSSSLLSLFGWIGGLWMFRWPSRRAISLVLWASAPTSSLLFLLGVLFIVSTPV